jgi:2-dehydro-3-deoxygluconokinase
VSRVVALGECMVELAPATNGLFAMGYAGDTFNTAWYLRHRLPASVEVSYVTAVGVDAVSHEMLRFMADEGIDTRHVAHVTGRTVGLYMIHLKNAERSFSYWRSTSAARLLADDASQLDAALSGATLAYLSGITLAILAPDARARLAAALATARAAGTRIAFDTNIRPALWSDPDTMRQTLMATAAAADIVLPSFEDEARHFGDADPAATAARYGRAGARLVVVKDGPNPVVTLAAGGPVTAHAIPAPVTAVVDSTAAGDSFNAGFLASQLEGADLATAVTAGATLAARVITGPGALVRSAVTAVS